MANIVIPISCILQGNYVTYMANIDTNIENNVTNIDKCVKKIIGNYLTIIGNYLTNIGNYATNIRKLNKVGEMETFFFTVVDRTIMTIGLRRFQTLLFFFVTPLLLTLCYLPSRTSSSSTEDTDFSQLNDGSSMIRLLLLKHSNLFLYVDS